MRYEPMHPYEAAAAEIARMEYLTTETLIVMALRWATYPEAAKFGARQCWEYISTDEAAAARCLESQLEADPIGARLEAAEALALGGWTRSTINYRNS